MNAYLSKLPAWAQHLVIIFGSTFLGSNVQAVITAAGVTGVSWGSVELTALDAAAVATAMGIAALWALPLNQSYGLGKAAKHAAVQA